MANKTTHLERIPNGSYLLRVGPEGWQYGEPYELMAVVVDLGNGECEIRGLDHHICCCHWRAMVECGRKHGFKVAYFDRIHEGQKIRRSVIL